MILIWINVRRYFNVRYGYAVVEMDSINILSLFCINLFLILATSYFAVLFIYFIAKLNIRVHFGIFLA